MTRVAPIGEGDTTQWDVSQWAIQQGVHMPTGLHQCVLMYLSLNAFYSSDNPEEGEVGQVLKAASRSSAISQGTGIKSRETIRKVLNDLQENAYLYRQERTVRGATGAQPHLIYVLWDGRWDRLRDDVRNGRKQVPPKFLDRPAARVRKAPKLALVHSISEVG